jgi:hypothetical protein
MGMPPYIDVNKSEDCSHPVPENDIGIFAYHSKDNEPMPMEDQQAFIDGPIRAAQEDLAKERSKANNIQ